MKYLEQVVIQQAIVHLVDSEESKLTLSTRELTMAKNPELSEYFQDHIKKSLRDSSARTASFSDGAKFRTIANKALGFPSKFVEASQETARHLFESSDKRISSGAVAVCLYSSPQEPKVTRFLAILKLDPADAFHPVEQTDKKGNIYVEFEKVKDVVPSKGEKLLKCAFIRPALKSGQADFDMVVLDQQKSASNEPAKFFISKFLGADYFGHSSDMTRKFYTASVRTVDLLRPTIGHGKAEDIRKSIDVALTGASVDVEQWVNNLTINQSGKDTLKTALTTVIPDRTFDVDEEVAKSMTKKRIFKSHGFRMTIDHDAYHDIVKGRKKMSGYEEIILHVPDLEEVVR